MPRPPFPRAHDPVTGVTDSRLLPVPHRYPSCEAAAVRAEARVPLYTTHSSPILALHVAVMDSAVPSLATLPAACCFRSIRSGLQQVRFLRKLMSGKGFYMDVLCYLLKAWKRYAVPAAIASCCHGCSCALLASRLSSLTRYGAVLSSCIPCRCQHFASQSSGTQGRLKSRKVESGL